MVSDSTDDVICHTVEYFSISYFDETLTEPGSEMRPISFLNISVIIIFSALFFLEARKASIKIISSSNVLPLLEVPFMGLQNSLLLSRLKNNSGDADIIIFSSVSI